MGKIFIQRARYYQYNLKEYKKFIQVVSGSMMQLTFKKPPLG
jgi:hypothetical protein